MIIKVEGMAAAIRSMAKQGKISRCERISDISTNEAEKFTRRAYIEYNHASIGDCGNIALYLEKVPLYFANAIQNHALYNGVEASTRYINMESCWRSDIPGHDGWMELYSSELHRLIKKYDNRAKALDIARSLLPITTHTSLSWYGSVRSINNHLNRLFYFHHDDKVKRMAWIMLNELIRESDGLFFEKKQPSKYSISSNKFAICKHDNLSFDIFKHESHHPLPGRVERERMGNRASSAYVKSVSNVNIGLARELMRHRTLSPLSSDWNKSIEFDPYYIENHFSKISGKIKKLAVDNKAVPALGSMVSLELSGKVQDFVYMIELRNGRSAHPDAIRFSRKHAKLLMQSGFPVFSTNRDTDYESRMSINPLGDS